MAGRIQFQCPKCQADFGVDAQYAGKPCRCKHCGQNFRVPGGTGAPQPAAPRAAPQPALAGAGVQSPRPQTRGVASPPPAVQARPTNWVDAVTSQIALKPVTMDQMYRIGGRAAQYMDEDVQSGPYEMASFPSLPMNKKPRTGVVKGVKKIYSNELRMLQKWLRWINETALELSVPFFVLMPLGFILKNHWLSMFGLTMVLLLNAGRFFVGVGNLLVIPFRESPMTGLMFLVPPFGYSYLKRNWHKCRKPFQRVISPVCFMLGMILIYIFVPWFSNHGHQKTPHMVQDKTGKMVPDPNEKQPEISVEDQVRKGLKSLRKDVREQIGDVREKIPSATTKLEKTAEKVIGEVQETAQDLKEKISNELPAKNEANP